MIKMIFNNLLEIKENLEDNVYTDENLYEQRLILLGYINNILSKLYVEESSIDGVFINSKSGEVLSSEVIDNMLISNIPQRESNVNSIFNKIN